MPHPLLERARQEGTPLIDGETVTLVWRGRQSPQLIGDFNDWYARKALKLRRAAPGVWTRKVTLPLDAYVEYAYVRPNPSQRGKSKDAKRVSDLLNPRITPNGMGEFNHFFYMPKNGPTPLAQPRRGVLRGTVTRQVLLSPFLVVGGRRAVYLYRPPTAEPCPLLVVYDGPDYLRRGRLPTIVDNLIAQGRIRPLALAMITNGGKARFIEYACSESTLAFVQYEVLPLALTELNLIDPEAALGAHAVLGASMGGLMALYTGVRLPHLFGHELCQSGAFTTNGVDQVIYDLIRDGSPRPLKVWMDAGQFDIRSLLPANHRMRDLLVARGCDVTYREYNAGHNYPAWRDDLWRGLELLFSPALS